MGGGLAPGHEEGCCSARSCHGMGSDVLSGCGPDPRPGLRALGRRPGGGPQCWDQSQTGQEAPAARGAGTGLRRPEGASDSALLQPSPGRRAGGPQRTVAGPSMASIPRRPALLPQQRTSPLGPAGLAPFFRHPYPSGSSQPPPTFPGPGAPPQTQVESTVLSLTCADPRGRTRSPLREEQGWGIYFFSPFLFFNKKN